MAKVKLYTSRVWLKRKWEVEKLSEQQIAELAGTSQPTIHRWLEKFGLIKSR